MSVFQLFPLLKRTRQILSTVTDIADSRLKPERLTEYDRAASEITAARMRNLDFRDPVYKLKQLLVTTSAIVTIPEYVQWINLVIAGGGGGGRYSIGSYSNGGWDFHAVDGMAGTILSFDRMPLYTHQINCLVGSKGLGQQTSTAFNTVGGNTVVQINGLALTANGGGNLAIGQKQDAIAAYPYGVAGQAAVLNTSIATGGVGFVAGGGGGYSAQRVGGGVAVLPYAAGADGTPGLVIIEYLEKIQG